MTDQTIRNCFWKSEISLEAQESATDDHDDPFKLLLLLFIIALFKDGVQT